ncbi:MAG TPA: hypothetical protein EYQ26_10990 [Rhodospirillales bacterium]|nr:hypothetical protein [Rhodospirillales bacterium]
MSNISSAEGMARIFLSKAKSGGVSDKLDGPWFARKLCEEAGKFIKNGQSLPPTLSDWLAKGLNSAANGESLETALLIKKSKGGTSKYTHDVHSFIVLVAFTAVNQKISINKAIPLVAT